MNIAQFPKPGETVIGHDYKIAFGGKGANAVACGRSGADITFIACVGDDAIGREIIAQLKQIILILMQFVLFPRHLQV